MTFLEFIKKYQNLDLFIVLMDELGYPDEEIITKLEVAKGSLYNARKRLEPLMTTLADVKDIKVVYGNPAVNTIVEAFKDSFGTTITGKYDRFAAKRLADKYGAEAIVAIIKAMASYSDRPFYPTLNSVKDLEVKWVSVGQFLSKQSNNLMVEL